MAFISSGLMAKKELERNINQHPLLGQMDVKPNVKMAYLQGCVLGTLLDDEQVSEEERMKVRRIGLSLGMSDDEITECFEVVVGLKCDDDKSAFIDELKGALGEPVVSKYFMSDFKEILEKDGEMPEQSVDYLNFIGSQVTGRKDWHSAICVGNERTDSEDTREISSSANTAQEREFESLLEKANGGSAADEYLVGLAYRDGYGVEQNERESAKYLARAAGHGSVRAQGLLGFYYYSGSNGFKHDLELAGDWAYRAACEGDSVGQLTIGMLYEHGGGAIKKNMAEAFRWYLSAAENGSAVGMYWVGAMYCRGEGIERDANEGQEWLKKAADAGDEAAKEALAEWFN